MILEELTPSDPPQWQDNDGNPQRPGNGAGHNRSAREPRRPTVFPKKVSEN